jgi:malate dehydrogenase (oxaloacetate-decarboxylating)(NADP+)
MIVLLSNPISKSECTYEDAAVNTDGCVLFASGSPFDLVAYQNKTYNTSQGNNMYVFSGIGLGSIICKASHVTASMVFAAGEAVPRRREKRRIEVSRLTRIREVSSCVTLRVSWATQEENVGDCPYLKTMSETQLEALIQARMYKPHSFSGEI